MIVYGTRAKETQSQHLSGVTCPACQSQQITTHGVQRYFHVYWLPLFPTKSFFLGKCGQCGYELNDSEMGGAGAAVRAQQFSLAKKAPYFSGIAVIAVLVVALFFVGEKSSEQDYAYLAQPQAQDTYLVKLTGLVEGVDSGHPYGVLRLESVSDGVAHFKIGKVTYNKAKGARKDISSHKADASDYYSEGTLDIEVAKLPSLKHDGAIQSVYRS